MKSLSIKAHTLSFCTSQNLAKSVLSRAQGESQISVVFPLGKITTPDTQPDTTMYFKINSSRSFTELGGQEFQLLTPNSGYLKKNTTSYQQFLNNKNLLQ